MAVEWQETRLGELVDVKHGFAFSGEHIHDEPRGHILMTPGSFRVGGGFKGDKLKYYDGPIPSEFVLQEGDLLVTMTDLSKQSDTLGYPAIVPLRSDGRNYLHNQRLGKISVRDDAMTDLRYIYYVLCSGRYRHEVLASASGTTVKHTSPDRIKEFRFPVASLPEQRRIARILSTLDDKIELNRRMSETLDAIAQALFKSWFVDFDPVRAKLERRDSRLPEKIAGIFPTRLVESQIGEIPEGWEVRQLTEMIEVNPIRRLRKGQVAPYLDMANMPTVGHTPDTVAERAFGTGMRFTNGDTLVARITPCLENGKTAYVDFMDEGAIGWGSTEYIVMRANPPLPREFSYCLARSPGFRRFMIKNMSGTSGRQRVSPQSLSHFLLPAPSEQVALAFETIVRPLVERARDAARESRFLGKVRDALLPKLISAELRTVAQYD